MVSSMHYLAYVDFVDDYVRRMELGTVQRDRVRDAALPKVSAWLGKRQDNFEKKEDEWRCPLLDEFGYLCFIERI
jgi:hypothetical protein